MFIINYLLEIYSGIYLKIFFNYNFIFYYVYLAYIFIFISILVNIIEFFKICDTRYLLLLLHVINIMMHLLLILLYNFNFWVYVFRNLF